MDLGSENRALIDPISDFLSVAFASIDRFLIHNFICGISLPGFGECDRRHQSLKFVNEIFQVEHFIASCKLMFASVISNSRTTIVVFYNHLKFILLI